MQWSAKGLAATVVELAGAGAHAAKIEAECRRAALHHGARQHVRDLVVQGAAVQRVRMAGHAEGCRRGVVVGEFELRLQRACRAGDAQYLGANQRMSTSSTSNTSVAPGGMTPPAPRAP